MLNNKLSPQSLLRDTSWSAEFPWLMACPACGGENVHLEAVYSLRGCDDREGKPPSGAVCAGTTPFRRAALVIGFHCEADHDFLLLFQQHKGVEFVRCRILEGETKPKPSLSNPCVFNQLGAPDRHSGGRDVISQ